MAETAYKVSSGIAGSSKAVLENAKVKHAFEFLKNDCARRVEEQIMLAMIPAPTFHEKQKAQKYCEILRSLGLSDAHLDTHGNVMATRKGKGNGPRVLMEAHMDTVFPLDTKLEPRREGTRVYMPGITDDTAGMAMILSVVRAMNDARIETEGDIVFGGTVGEEGLGGLCGITSLVAENKFDADLSIDGSGFGRIVCDCMGDKVIVFTFHGKGGHASGAFGLVSNTVNAAASAVSKIMQIRVPEDGKTIFCVSNFHAGSDAGICAIPDLCEIKINIRSTKRKYLEDLEKQVIECVKAGCQEEGDRWGVEPPTWEMKYIESIPVAEQDEHAPIIEGAYSVISAMGVEPGLTHGSITNMGPACASGVQAVCLSSGGGGAGSHSLDEYFDSENCENGAQAALALACLMAGLHGVTEPVAKKG